MADSCGADVLAGTLLTNLIAGKTFEVPVVDFDPSRLTVLTNEALTTRNVGGSGTFDAVMESVFNHLKREFENGRITGQEYTKAYIELTGTALSGAVQYLLGKDQAYWGSILIQQQVALARIQTLTAETEYALMKMKLATEDATYCGILRDNEIKVYNLDIMLPAQKKLLDEQIEVQRAQTLDTRTDGLTIVGSVGKQKDLYSQQIISYQRDAEVKAAKMFVDAWITQKTLDEGLTAPTGFTNASLDTILSKLKLNNALT